MCKSDTSNQPSSPHDGLGFRARRGSRGGQDADHVPWRPEGRQHHARRGGGHCLLRLPVVWQGATRQGRRREQRGCDPTSWGRKVKMERVMGVLLKKDPDRGGCLPPSQHGWLESPTERTCAIHQTSRISTVRFVVPFEDFPALAVSSTAGQQGHSSSHRSSSLLESHIRAIHV